MHFLTFQNLINFPLKTILVTASCVFHLFYPFRSRYSCLFLIFKIFLYLFFKKFPLFPLLLSTFLFSSPFSSFICFGSFPLFSPLFILSCLLLSYPLLPLPFFSLLSFPFPFFPLFPLLSLPLFSSPLLLPSYPHFPPRPISLFSFLQSSSSSLSFTSSSFQTFFFPSPLLPVTSSLLMPLLSSPSIFSALFSPSSLSFPLFPSPVRFSLYVVFFSFHLLS
jgi:hypothetical protein